MDDALKEVERLVDESTRSTRNRRLAKPKKKEEPVDFDDDAEEVEETEEEVEAPKRSKPRVRKIAESEMEEVTSDQVDRLLPPQNDIPAPEEKVKSLDDMYAKFGIGTRPEFKAQVWRLWPKMAPGGAKFDGYYDTWDQPLSLDEIQREYGGGNYRVVVVGPHPSSPGLQKRYASHMVELPGDPRYDRKPRSATTGAPAHTEAQIVIPPPVQMPQENVKLQEQAMKMMFEVSERERDERRRAEEKAEARTELAHGAMTPVIEAERRAAQTQVEAARDRADLERRSYERQLEEQRLKNEELRREMEERFRSQPSIATELAQLAQAGLLGQKDDSGIKVIVEQILERHQRELTLLHEQNAKFVEALRSAHQTEMAAIRESQRRELESEREAGKTREQRIEDRLNSEREERRRDQERERQRLEERDIAWKDRLEQALQSKEQSWESRHQSLLSGHEVRIMSMMNEVERLKSELDDAKRKAQDVGDPITQMLKMREMQTVMKDVFDIKDPVAAPATGGGIGIGGGDDWKQSLVEGLTERLPAILEMVSGRGGAPGGQPAPQQTYQPGQVVQTPNGPMVVVVDPASGQLALAPQAAVEAHERSMREGQGKSLLPDGGGQRRRRPASRMARPNGEKPERKSVSVTQNLSEGLPRRAAPWEGGGEISNGPPQPPPAPPAQPRMRTRPATTTPSDAPNMELSPGERQVLKTLAKEVNDHVLRGDEPEDLVEKLLATYPHDALRRGVGQYSVQQVARGIVQVEPSGAGATPAGQKFVLMACAELQNALKQG